MSAQFARAPHQGRTGPLSNLPHAALLIDFDNVTMGIRSDLTKELKNLLNSDIIKGKVAVQRAYADWRRYPQYIVPLAESSVDLIFAPAYGSAKKNATDIRLAIDALELVFVRPEIGTFILLSGDSDFSSLVLKLKEYGKYVVGVGIRESASDLLVQNCDEYYSYSALTGLTRAGDEAPVVSEDPWELVELAIRQMVENDDVMRSDRLKQVLLELDSNFDEKALGFTKFNKFLQDAANRGVLSLRKQENGQFEIAPGDGTPSGGEEEEQRSRRRRGGRGRRGREEREHAPAEIAAAAVAPAAETQPGDSAAKPSQSAAKPADSVVKPAESVAKPAESAAKPEESARADVRAGAAPRALRDDAAPATKPADRPARDEKKAPAKTRDAEHVAPVGNDLEAAFALLRRATQNAQRQASGGTARDSDVKRHLLALDPTWDEANLGFSKFSRFLRRAHDEDVITLRRLDNGNYELAAGVTDVADEPRGRRGRGGASAARGAAEAPARPARDAAATPPADRDGQSNGAAKGKPAEPAVRAPADTVKPGDRTERPAAAAAAASRPAPAASVQPSMFEDATSAKSARPTHPIGLRRGSRSRGGASSGPPPLFEGQTAGTKAAPAARQQTGEPAATPASAAIAPATPAWFPSEQAALLSHLSSYKGVGRKTAEQLVDAFGVDGVFAALSGQQDRVRELLGQRRADTLLAAFEAEVTANGAAAPAAGAARQAKTAAAKKGGARAKRPASKAVSKSAPGGTAAAPSTASVKTTSSGSAPAKKAARKTARKSGRGGTKTPSK